VEHDVLFCLVDGTNRFRLGPLVPGGRYRLWMSPNRFVPAGTEFVDVEAPATGVVVRGKPVR